MHRCRYRVQYSGFCGTGLINLLSFLLRSELVEKTGKINEETIQYKKLVGYSKNEEPFIILDDSHVILTGRDICQLQLTKAAINAGILTLCHTCKISPDQVDHLFLCGSFGSVINPQNSVLIELILNSLAPKVVPLGNAAGQGASMMFQYENCIDGATAIAEMTSEIPLSTSSFFTNQYVKQIMF